MSKPAGWITTDNERANELEAENARLLARVEEAEAFSKRKMDSLARSVEETQVMQAERDGYKARAERCKKELVNMTALHHGLTHKGNLNPCPATSCQNAHAVIAAEALEEKR